MRRFCFLISSVVLNVLAVLEIHHDKFLVELIKQTNLTNRQIQRVQCGDVRLIPVIKQFVLADKPMTDLSLMFAGPLVVSEPNHDDETLQHRIDSEIELQTAITTLLGVPVHEEGVAVPEEGVAVREEDRPRSLVRTAMRTLCCSSEPQDSSGVADPDKSRPKGGVCTAMRNLCCPPEPQDTPDLNTVPGLATERKTLFRDATKLFISSALRPGHENFGNCNLICRLKGIWRSDSLPTVGNRDILHGLVNCSHILSVDNTFDEIIF